MVSEGELCMSSGGGGRETLDQGWIISLFCLKKKDWNKHEFLLGMEWEVEPTTGRMGNWIRNDYD